jgi:hypothetical protein
MAPSATERRGFAFAGSVANFSRGSDFKGGHFERDVILWGVRWHLA